MLRAEFALKCLTSAALAGALAFAPSVVSASNPVKSHGPGISQKSVGGKPVAAPFDRPGSKSATTSTLAPVPTKVEPLLRRLLKAAALVNLDNQSAAMLSERYDLERYKLEQARLEVAKLDRTVHIAERRQFLAGIRLRNAAVAAYVAGELYGANADVLLNNQSQGQMAEVYTGVALGQLRRALSLYTIASSAAHRSRASALKSSVEVARTLAGLATLKTRARLLMSRAASAYLSISHRLRHLVGAKEFARLFPSWPAGSPYLGPNLAGTHVLKVATASEGLRVVMLAERFLGVPYVFGGAGRSGVDCSGLTMLAWATAGISLVHSATLQWEESRPVSLDDLAPGDLLFYHFAHDGQGTISHVVMYVGSGPYGVETVIQAAEPGTNVAFARIYFDGFVSAGRP